MNFAYFPNESFLLLFRNARFRGNFFVSAGNTNRCLGTSLMWYSGCGESCSMDCSLPCFVWWDWERTEDYRAQVPAMQGNCHKVAGWVCEQWNPNMLPITPPCTNSSFKWVNVICLKLHVFLSLAILTKTSSRWLVVQHLGSVCIFRLAVQQNTPAAVCVSSL